MQVHLQSKFDKLTTPMLHNVDFAHSANGRNMAEQLHRPGLLTLLATQGIFRPSDLYRIRGHLITDDSLSHFLLPFNPGLTTSVGACTKFLERSYTLFGTLW